MHKLNTRLVGRLALAGLLAATLPTLTGCTAMSRGIGKITANKYAAARSGTVWVVPPPQLDPPAPEDKTVYISYRNLSDADLDLTQLLRDSATNQGWTLVNNPQEAKFRLRAQTRFFGEVVPESGGKDVANAMGAVAGAAVGIGTYALVENMSDNWAVGAGAGAAVGGLVGLGMANASQTREWALINDFVLDEYSPEELEFEVLSENSSAGTSGATVGNDRMGEGGANTTGNSRNASMTQKSNYFPHGVRLSTWANQMNMNEEEAMPQILERTQKVVQQMLPQ